MSVGQSVQKSQQSMAVIMLITVTPVVGVKGGGLYGGVVAPLSIAPDPVESEAGGGGHGVKPGTLKHCVRCSGHFEIVLWKYSMVYATLNLDGKLTGTGAILPLLPAHRGSPALYRKLKVTFFIK